MKIVMKIAMKIDLREVAAALAPGLLLALGMAALLGVLAATATPAERGALWAALEPRGALVFMLWLLGALGGGVSRTDTHARRGVPAAGRLSP